MALRDLIVRVSAESGPAHVALKKLDQDLDKIVGGAQRGQSSLNKMGEQGARSLSRLQRAAEKVLPALHKGIDLAVQYRTRLMMMGAGITATMGVAIKQSMDAAEMVNVFNVVFGEQAEAVRKWAYAWADSLGLSRYKTLRYLATVQDLFVPLGYTREAAANLSKQIVKLAADVSSFKNIPVEEVIRKTTSALMGEYRSVREGMGVLLNEKLVTAEINKNKKLYAGLTEEQAKVQARLNLIVQGSKDAIGDLERTMDSTANTLRRVKDQSYDLSIALGAPWQRIVQKGANLLGKLFHSIAQHQALSTAISVVYGLSGALMSGIGALGMYIFAWRQVRTTFIGVKALQMVEHIKTLGIAIRLAAMDPIWFARNMMRLVASYAAAIKFSVWYRAALLKERVTAIASTVANSALGTSLTGVAAGFAAGAKAVWGFTAALLANPITWVVVGLAALGSALYVLIQHFGGLRKVLAEIGRAFTRFGDRLKSVPRAFEAVWEKIKAGFASFVNWFRKALGWLRRLLPFSPAKEGPLKDLDRVGAGFIGTIVDSIRSNIPRLETVAREVAQKLQTSTAKEVKKAGVAVGEVAAASQGEAAPAGSKTASISQNTGGKGLSDLLSSALSGDFSGLISQGKDWLLGQAQGLLSGILPEGVGATLSGLFSSGAGGLVSSLSGLLGGSGGTLLSSLGGLLSGGAGGVLSGLLGGAGGGALTTLLGAAGGPIGMAIGALAPSLLSGLFGEGGMLSGLGDMVSGLFGEGGGMLSGLLSAGGNLLSGLTGGAGSVLSGVASMIVPPPPPVPVAAGAGGPNVVVNLGGVTVNVKGTVSGQPEDISKAIGSALTQELEHMMIRVMIQALGGKKSLRMKDEKEG